MNQVPDEIAPTVKISTGKQLRFRSHQQEEPSDNR